jgi:glycosyltransferase involved in cell wall biosynthesis
VNNEDTSFFSLYSEKVIRIPLWHEKIELCEDYAKVQNRILFVGRSASNKGLEYLALLDNKKYDIHCVISNYRNENYIIHNEISDVQLQNLYQSSSLLIVPSKYESFSLVALESLVCGTPILVSDKVRITDYLTGVSGVTIFEYGNKDDFLEKIDIAMKQRVNLDMVDNIFSSKMAYNNYRKIFMDT